MLIFAGRTSQVLPASPAPVRAYDVRTGRLRWQFNTIPRPGEFGYETWPKDAWKYTAGAVSWAGMTLDQQRGIVYVPVSNCVNNNIGRDRLGDNLFCASILALDANTGKRVWHYQTVQHDVWDRDVNAPPTLITVQRDGRNVDALALATKSGYLWTFDRTEARHCLPSSARSIHRAGFQASSCPRRSRCQPSQRSPVSC
jgi:quinoprotein glucose dehydrogenase